MPGWACHKKFGPPQLLSPMAKYFEMFGPWDQKFQKYLDLTLGFAPG